MDLICLADALIDFIFTAGAPKEIRVSSVIVEGHLSQICEAAGIRLRKVKYLPGIEEFWEGMEQFR